MANQEHLDTLRQGVEVWNKWRAESLEKAPDLSRADLSGTVLSDANLSSADLSRADLSDANLRYANLIDANLNFANLSRADLFHAFLSDANLSRATLRDANLSDAALDRATLIDANLGGAILSAANLNFATLINANLSAATLINANLSAATLIDATLDNADLSRTRIAYTTFGNSDLSLVKGLESVSHAGPSTIGIDTIYRSQGKIPESFLRDAGIHESFITHMHSLVGAVQPIQFYSCFISYSHKDEEFAQRLHSRMRAEQLRVWYAPEDIKGGEKLHEQIYSAIQVHDRLLLVLSEHSISSEWVMTELRRARKTELKENRRKLFPIRLVDFETIKEWECFDADSGKDLAIEVREYFIPDFSNWKDHDAFEKGFKKLLNDLKAEESK